MGLHQEHHDRMVKSVFGPGARFDADLGTPTKPGSVRIVIDNREIGVGPTFQAALVNASRQLSEAAR